jgi:hypothetical protein
LDRHIEALERFLFIFILFSSSMATDQQSPFTTTADNPVHPSHQLISVPGDRESADVSARPNRINHRAVTPLAVTPDGERPGSRTCAPPRQEAEQGRDFYCRGHVRDDDPVEGARAAAIFALQIGKEQA